MIKHETFVKLMELVDKNQIFYGPNSFKVGFTPLTFEIPITKFMWNLTVIPLDGKQFEMLDERLKFNLASQEEAALEKRVTDLEKSINDYQE
jgi:hypothetical protein